MTSFSLGDTDFLRDGQPHQVISGAIHYFRVHPDQWRDRIRKARLMGLNTIETYVAWNAHEPRRGEWDASGWNDLGRFLDLVHEEGMDAIVRPGPYICAEWHNGGLPVWLTGSVEGLRSSAPAFLAEVSTYLRRVYDIVAPRQIDHGGPVILVQIENEYGAYGSDPAYLEALVAVTREAGITVPLTSVDQPVDRMLDDGSLPELHKTGSFGSRSAERLATLRRHQPTGPLMCAEFWDGWFDWWGGVHHTTDVATAAADLDELLAAGASVNIYMFHGGTNFGLTNGANHKGRYLPLVTSYDYDAPLDEAGNPTAKFFAFREVIARYAPVPDELPTAAEASPAFEVPLRPAGAWADAAASAAVTAQPRTFDALGHLSALMRYDAELPNGKGGLLVVDDVRDLAWVSVDGHPVGTLARTRHDRAIRIPDGTGLRILVEDQGRVNYDHRLGEEKGLYGEITLSGAPVTGWRSTPLDVADIAAQIDAQIDAEAGDLSPNHERDDGPAAWTAEFPLDAPADLFVDTASWGKGYAFVNGFFLGRYWRNGPQRALSVPAPVTRAGANRLVVLELEHVLEPRVVFVGAPALGDTEE
ncbi:beta-galactosidase family protein [Microbacterium sp. NPDC091662]|uniref:glycoside hydrolase family 35 protein n=1 Tax=Microbacterium sp. NPDC091662 TaxID=3364211 RepID=UPI00381C5DA4